MDNVSGDRQPEPDPLLVFLARAHRIARQVSETYQVVRRPLLRDVVVVLLVLRLPDGLDLLGRVVAGLG